MHRDSGTLRGSRALWEGRVHGWATLSMRTLVAGRSHPVRQAWYGRLRAQGKVAKVARTACMRTLLTILNAMGKHHKT